MRALRVLLVFTLVFWSSLRIELLAFADDDPPASTDTPTTTEPAEPSNPAQPSEPSGGDNGNSPASDNPGTGTEGGTGGTGNNGTGTDTGNGNTDNTGGEQKPATTFKSLEVHLLNENPPANSTDPLKHVGALVHDTAAQAAGTQQPNKPKIDTVKGELKFVPVIVKTDGSKLDASSLVQWSVQGQFTEFAEFTSETSGVLKAKGAKDSEIVAVCKLKSEAFSQFNLTGGTVEVQFRVDIMEQAGAYIESIDILDASGNVVEPSKTLKLDMTDGKELSQQFSARLNVRDPSSKAAKPTYTVTSADKGLGEHDQKLVDSLTWSVSDAEDSSISKTGLFETTAKLEAAITCSSKMGPGGNAVSTSITVNTGVDTDVQGASHPQDTLLVIAPSEVVKVEGDAGAGEGDAGAGGASDDAANPDNASAIDDNANPDNASATDDTQDATDSKPAPEPVNKAYSLDELSGLGWSTATFTFKPSNGTTNVPGNATGETTITGAGPSLVALLEDAGVDLSKVRSVTFVNYQGDTQTIAWSAMGGEDSAAILAASSAVHVDGQPAPSGDAGLLKNTRFRLLVSDGASIDSALPWINTIRVNGDGSGSGGSGTTDDSLRAVIGYMPVAKGNTAVLSASVVGLYQNEQFGYEWQQSNDGGITWSGAIDTAQTIRVPTSDSTIGRMYRVIATTNSGRKAESSPVTISENTGFSVALAYDPPLAGEMAFFTTSVTGVDPTEITDYIWEWTEDGGATWQEIAGSRGKPTFSARTDPVSGAAGEGAGAGGEADEPGAGTGSEGDGSGSGSGGDAPQEVDKTPAPSMWVHVRVLATGGRETVSNPVMLTVHVSDEGGSGHAPTEDIPDEPLPDEQSAPGSDDPQVTPPEETDDPNAAGTGTTPSDEPAPAPVIQEVTSITVETGPRPQSTSTATTVTSEAPATEQTPDGTQTAPTPESAPSDSPTDLIINAEVSAQIIEQREAADAAVQATHPGARWTALSTVEPDGKDVKRILNDNPFAPFVAPIALGMTAAGALESFLGFRRKIR